MKVGYRTYIWDGGDRNNPGPIFLDKESAEKHAGPHGHTSKEIIYDDLEDYEENNPSAARKRALDKLTPEDKYALGLSDS